MNKMGHFKALSVASLLDTAVYFMSLHLVVILLQQSYKQGFV